MGVGRHAKRKGNKKGRAKDKVHLSQAEATKAHDEALAAEAAARTAAEKQAAAAEARKRSAELKETRQAVRKRLDKRHERDGTAPPGVRPKRA